MFALEIILTLLFIATGYLLIQDLRYAAATHAANRSQTTPSGDAEAQPVSCQRCHSVNVEVGTLMDRLYAVRCSDCDHQGLPSMTSVEAIQTWNANFHSDRR